MPVDAARPLAYMTLMAMDVSEAGRMGGLKRTKQMTAEQRTKLARKAARARWRKRRKNSKG